MRLMRMLAAGFGIWATGAAAQSGRSEAGLPVWKRLAYVAVTRAERRLMWVTRYALARPAAPLGTDDLSREAPALELEAETED